MGLRLIIGLVARARINMLAYRPVGCPLLLFILLRLTSECVRAWCMTVHGLQLSITGLSNRDKLGKYRENYFSEELKKTKESNEC